MTEKTTQQKFDGAREKYEALKEEYARVNELIARGMAEAEAFLSPSQEAYLAKIYKFKQKKEKALQEYFRDNAMYIEAEAEDLKKGWINEELEKVKRMKEDPSNGISFKVFDENSIKNKIRNQIENQTNRMFENLAELCGLDLHFSGCGALYRNCYTKLSKESDLAKVSDGFFDTRNRIYREAHGTRDDDLTKYAEQLASLIKEYDRFFL